MYTFGTANYAIRIVHPVTGKFIGELDPDRLLLLTVDKRIIGIIDLAQKIAEWRAQGATMGTPTFT